MKMQLTSVFFAAAFLWSLAGLGQVEFKARPSRNKVAKSERFTIQFEVNAHASDFSPPDFSGFRVLSGPSRSTSMQVTNFESSVKTSFSYELMATRTGTLGIGAASIKVEGKTYYSDPVGIIVTEQSETRSDPNDPYAQAAKKAFFRVITNKNAVYQGEPLVASYKLYFSTNVDQPNVLSEPDYTGFYKNNIELKRIETSEEYYRGANFTTGIIRQLVLVPQRSGTIRPGRVELQIPTQVPTNRRDAFGRQYVRTINQTAVEDFPAIKVLPLPDEGRPASFDGAVGDYKMDVSLSRQELTANESVSLKITISGKGNIKLVEAPEPKIPQAFEAFDPEFKEDVNVNASGMYGSKTYQYLLVPRYGGTYKIPEIEFSYFDPGRRSYRTLRSEEMKITVTGGTPQPGATSAPGSNETEQVDFIGKDILFIKTKAGDFDEVGQQFLGSTAFYTALGGMGLALAGMLAFFFMKTNRASDQQRLKSKKAGKVARKHLSQAKKALDKGQDEEFYLALSSALWGYFADKFAIPQSRLNKDIIRDTLLARGVETQTADEVLEIMNRAEMARFTSAKGEGTAHDYEETARLLTKIEDRV